MSRLSYVLVILLVATRVYAADDPNSARTLFMSGTKHFDLGEYEQALSDFKEAYRIKDDPVLLYNIGQCQRMLKHNEDALRAYKTYLSRATDAVNRADVERKIATLQEAIDKQNRAAESPPRDQAPPPSVVAPPAPAPVVVAVAPAPERTPVYKRWWLWTAVGGVVVAGVAVGLGVGLTQHKDSLFPAVSY
jgi:tetratricopeptide (TPR) repeat protein